METVPVDVEEQSSEQELPAKQHSFGELGIKHYSLPQLPAGTYRLYFENGEHQDVQAENASHAYQLGDSRDVVRIVNLPVVISGIMESDVIEASNDTVTFPIENTQEHDAFILAELEERDAGVFQRMDYGELSVMGSQNQDHQAPLIEGNES